MAPVQMQFSLVSAISYALLLFAVAIIFSGLMSRVPIIAKSTTVQDDRFGCLDGLRGLLAVGVFIHHSFVAYVFFITGRWEWTASPIFNQLGQTTVALFFMITGFLFSTKLLRSKIYINLVTLYVGRVARLLPLYFVTVCLVVVTVFAMSGWELREPIAMLANELVRWLSFVIFGRPDINGYVDTPQIIAGVNWTLKFEWIFYCCLPFLYWPLRWVAKPIMLNILLPVLLILAVAFGIQGKVIGGVTLCFVYFACGTVVALIHFDSKFTAFARKPLIHFLSIPALVLLLLFKNANNVMAVLLTTYIFLAVSGGFSFFGLLRSRSVLWLGDISYGIYLLHGLVLFWVLRTLSVAGALGGMSAVSYSILVMTITCVVLLIASASFIYIEKPAITLWRMKSKTLTPSI